MTRIFLPVFSLFIIFCTPVIAQKKVRKAADSLVVGSPMQSATFSGLKFRSIGPALTSGRIVDLAINPQRPSEYYVATASGGVWKTTNAGVTYAPLFDNQTAYSIGCVALDPANPNIVWVGSGENNNQRVVGYGDGIYKSEDAGKSWKNMGLTKSEHIGQIAIDPTNTDVVYVAAYGPLWNSGGERGIYKTTDGGKSWKAVLTVSEHTGFNEVLIDPRNPKTIYAAAHQRQRKVFTYVGGGPESALYKSDDAGATWTRIMKGIPTGVDLGRIGMAMSPVNPDYLYAIVEAADGKGGFFASTDRGASWEKRSNYSTSGNYYQEIFCDPVDINKVYAMNVYLQVSRDGGKTFQPLGEKSKHVDNHVIWVNPKNTQHMLVGCDGGLYETYDEGKNWNFKANIPVTQFYKVSLDNSLPFYYVYGGTQDNFSLGGPSRTISANGIVNSDWFITNGGDGFESQADYKDSNTVYAESQYGGLVRFDRRTGESIDIKPVEPAGEQPYRWNWDAPLLISQHDHKRLYFASNRLFRTNDRGNTWKVISPDMSRGIDRNKLSIMGKVWSVDAVAKNASTDIYGQVTTIAESPIDENILFIGTDDGLIHTSKDGGATWTKIDNIPGVPANTYVNLIIASAHNKEEAYVAFNHHRYGDFKPYLFKTTDGGKSWTAIQSNLPQRGTVYCMAEDPTNKNLLFAGTEFGVFFSIDAGAEWIQLKGGLPPVAIKDMEIHKREGDLVLATFGRGYYVLDDYSPLRSLNKQDLDKPAFIAPVKNALMYIESMPLGIRGKGFQGESYWNTPNPKPGAVITYYLKQDLKTLRERRQEAEQQKIRIGDPPFYPSIDSLRKEDIEAAPYLLFTIRDAAGEVVRRLNAPAKKGVNRLNWDFRTGTKSAVSFTPFDETNVFSSPDQGIMVSPGTYTVSMSKFEDGKFSDLVPAQSFKVDALNMVNMTDGENSVLSTFAKKVEELYRVVEGTNAYSVELSNKIKYIKEAVLQTPGLPTSTLTDINALELRLLESGKLLVGDPTLAKREFEAPTSISNRIQNIMNGIISTTITPTATFKTSYDDAARQFAPVLEQVKFVATEINKLEKVLEQNGAPYTPGRLPDWKKQ
ncbi:glycosyl hydrolase [Segetibacter sp. 3557_3]|uniref:VPS10 domain-containing protein n=1 Tax=Segetibacter sp. 3557_3 TaxID=2547429 RepID=UPI0010583C2D|nr:glycosyl hydrolase [Segetibacter sp. 3557_3]TDH27995.1 glycosyl hydrolase [Segetibacter sp. 3557_3]